MASLARHRLASEAGPVPALAIYRNQAGHFQGFEYLFAIHYRFNSAAAKRAVRNLELECSLRGPQGLTAVSCRLGGWLGSVAAATGGGSVGVGGAGTPGKDRSVDYSKPAEPYLVACSVAMNSAVCWSVRPMNRLFEAAFSGCVDCSRRTVVLAFSRQVMRSDLGQ